MLPTTTTTNSRLLLWRFLIGFFADSIPGMLIATLLTLRLAERGLDAAWIGALVTIPALGYMGALLLMPRALARLGERRVFRAALLAGALANPLIIITDQIAIWALLSLVAGVAGAARYTIAEIWVPRLAPPGASGRALAWFQTLVGASFFVATLLLLATGIGGGAALPAVLASAAAGLLLLWPIQPGRAAAPAPQGRPEGRALQLAGAAALAAALLGGLFESGVTTALPLYGLQLGLDTTMATWLVTAVGLGSLAQYPFGALADRFAWQRVVVGTTVLIALSALLLPLAPSAPWVLWVLGFVWGSAGGGLYTLATIRNGARLAGAQLAAASAAIQFAYMGGGVAGPAMSGLALDIAPQHGLAALVGALGLAGLALVLVGAERPAPVAALE